MGSQATQATLLRKCRRASVRRSTKPSNRIATAQKLQLGLCGVPNSMANPGTATRPMASGQACLSCELRSRSHRAETQTVTESWEMEQNKIGEKASFRCCPYRPHQSPPWLPPPHPALPSKPCMARHHPLGQSAAPDTWPGSSAPARRPVLAPRKRATSGTACS